MRFLPLIMGAWFVVGIVMFNKVVTAEQRTIKAEKKAQRLRLAALCCKCFRPDGD